MAGKGSGRASHAAGRLASNKSTAKQRSAAGRTLKKHQDENHS